MAAIAWQLEQAGSIRYFRLSQPHIRCLFTTRSGRLGPSPGDSPPREFGGARPESLREHLERLKQELGISRLVTLKQLHSATVWYIDHQPISGDILEGDALFTDQPDLALAVKVADCLPVYLFTPPDYAGQQVVALAHAGWRGTRRRIVESLVTAISRKFRLPAADLHYAFGACIGPECYEIGPEVAREFHNFPAPAEFLIPEDDRFRLDLRVANRQLLRTLGLKETANLNLCTKCTPGMFFSARRDGVSGHNLALIMLSGAAC